MTEILFRFKPFPRVPLQKARGNDLRNWVTRHVISLHAHALLILVNLIKAQNVSGLMNYSREYNESTSITREGETDNRGGIKNTFRASGIPDFRDPSATFEVVARERSSTIIELPVSVSRPRRLDNPQHASFPRCVALFSCARQNRKREEKSSRVIKR